MDCGDIVGVCTLDLNVQQRWVLLKYYNRLLCVNKVSCSLKGHRELN